MTAKAVEKPDGTLETGESPSVAVVEDGQQPVVFVPRETAWSWVVCLASFWVHGVVFGLINCFGVLYPEIYKLAATSSRASFYTCE